MKSGCTESPRLFNVDELPKRTAVCRTAERRRAQVAKFGPPGNPQPAGSNRRGSIQDILTCAMGLDLHRDIIVACLAKGENGSDPEVELRTFSTLIPEMRKLRDWVVESGCCHVTMESTGIYWQPI